MLYNTSLLSLSVQCSLQASPFIFIPLALHTSNFYFNILSYKNVYSSFIHGSSNSNMHLSNSQFSRVISPVIYLSNDQANEVIQNAVFHTKKQNLVSDLTLINCTFTFCSSDLYSESNGGAVYIEKYISLRAKNCIFWKNEARRSGGAIYAKNSSVIDIDNCLFAENSCKMLSTIRLNKCEEVIVKNTNFTKNKAKGSSPALACSNIKKNVSLTTVYFFENEARLGGTLAIEKGDIEISNCLFYFNQVHSGAASIKSFQNVTMTIQNTKFSEELVPSIILSIGDQVTISNCQFSRAQLEEIKPRGAQVDVKDNNVFESAVEHKPIQLDPLVPPEELTKKNESQTVNKQESKDENKEENKEKNKAETKEENEEKNNEPVIEKHGDKKEPFVMLPMQKDVDKKSSIFTLIFVFALISIIVVIIICCCQKNKKTAFNDPTQTNSIFNNDDFDINENANYARTVGEKLADINVEDLPDVKMEKF
ncbi:hypothetical protein M9Y10_034760 [Tritrichomonas musculus]|uniref:Right handed beta helix domain-containing protein n=1 Tax=Tritrichomonas musculus TaxID=1915356 RepID=A0ABR2KGY0_9EUKA